MTNKCTKVSTSNCSNTKTSKNNSKVMELETVNDLMSGTSNNTKSCTHCTNTYTRNQENCKTSRRSKRLIATSAEPKKASYKKNVCRLDISQKNLIWFDQTNVYGGVVLDSFLCNPIDSTVHFILVNLILLMRARGAIN